MKEEKCQRLGRTLIIRSLPENTHERILQMQRETGLTVSKIASAVLMLYFGNEPIGEDE